MSEPIPKYFFCKDCKHLTITHAWLDQDGIVFTDCETCQTPVEEIPNQKIGMYRAIEAAKGKHTGPITEEGKAAAVEARKGTHTGPRTPEGKKRSSMNNYKHGKYSQNFSLLAPALPGHFAACDGCHYRNAGCGTEFKYCPVNIQPMVEMVRAYQEGDLTSIKEIAGIQQAKTVQVLEMMWQAVFKHGVLNPKVIKSKTELGDKKNDPIKEEIVMEWLANPLLKRIPEYMAVIGSTAEQNLMTPKSEREQDNVDGFLDASNEQKKKIESFQSNLLKSIEKLGVISQSAQNKRAADPALNDYNEQQGHENTNHE